MLYSIILIDKICFTQINKDSMITVQTKNVFVKLNSREKRHKLNCYYFV